MDDTALLQNKINDLQSRVDLYTNKEKNSFSIIKKFDIKKHIYFVIPIVVFILMAYFRPRFLYVEVKTKQRPVKKFSFSRFFAYWIGFSFLIILGIFGYLYHKNKKVN